MTTPALLDPVDALLEAILSGGRGYDGSLGARAQQCALPGSTNAIFTRCTRPLELVTELSVFDRAYHLAPDAGQDPLHPQSSYDPTVFESVRFTLTLGVVYGVQQPSTYERTYSGENASAALVNPALRLSGLEARARQALTWPELYEDASRDPFVVLVTVAAGQNVDLDGGRMVRVIPLTVTFGRRNAAYQPSPTP